MSVRLRTGRKGRLPRDINYVWFVGATTQRPSARASRVTGLTRRLVCFRLFPRLCGVIRCVRWIGSAAVFAEALVKCAGGSNRNHVRWETNGTKPETESIRSFWKSYSSRGLPSNFQTSTVASTRHGSSSSRQGEVEIFLQRCWTAVWTDGCSTTRKSIIQRGFISLLDGMFSGCRIPETQAVLE